MLVVVIRTLSGYEKVETFNRPLAAAIWTRFMVEDQGHTFIGAGVKHQR